ncbi:MAG: class I SAM-dependent methyltransferase [Promethearchaeota archaeon]
MKSTEKEEAYYGNWMPRTFIYICVALIIIPLILSVIFPWIVLKVILWVISAFFIFPLVYILGLYYFFSKNDGEIQHAIRNIVLEKLDWEGNGKVLDIGTGSGPLAINLAKKYPNSEAIGIDYWGKLWDYSLKLCENNANIEGVKDRVEFKRSSAANLPFEDEYFDAIVSNYVFHEVREVKDKSEVLKEAFRVLKKGGVFSLQDLFGNKRNYGTMEQLMEKIKSWNVEGVNYEKSLEIYQMPRFIKAEIGKTYVIYGKK